MAMDRRGFLKRMSAAAAVFTAAVSGRVAAAAGVDSVPAAAGPSTLRSSVDKAKPIAAAARKATPQVSISADTSRFEKSIGEAGADVVKLLRECRVTDSQWCMTAGELMRYRVIFEQRPAGAPLSALDAEAWKIIEKGYLTSVSVSSTGVDDLVDLNSGRGYSTGLQHSIEAEFIVRG